MKNIIKKFLATPGEKIRLADYDPGYDRDFLEDDAENLLHDDIKHLQKLQEKLYASNTYSVLIVLQAMDAAGKDSTIKHVMSGLNPQGCRVYSFKHPSEEEYEHDFLWRHYKTLPENGEIVIFNRSHYENVLICKVHPELVLAERIPGIDSVKKVDKAFWRKKYRQIRRFEKNIAENGTVILKFFLHLSKDEQCKRFLERIDNPEKNWKFRFGDINERNYWDDYHKAYEDAINETSTTYAPWYIIPADNKQYTRAAIANIIIKKLEKLNLEFPKLAPEEESKLLVAKKQLLTELNKKSGN